MAPSDSDRVSRRTLLDQFSPKADPADMQLMTDNYIIGTEGYYMPRESFLYLRKCERMMRDSRQIMQISILLSRPRDVRV